MALPPYEPGTEGGVPIEKNQASFGSLMGLPGSNQAVDEHFGTSSNNLAAAGPLPGGTTPTNPNPPQPIGSTESVPWVPLAIGAIVIFFLLD